MRVKGLSVLMVFALLFGVLFTACSSTTTENSSIAASNAGQTTAQQNSTEQSAAVQEVTSEAGSVKLPLTDKQVTLTVFVAAGDDFSKTGLKSNNDVAAFIELEKRTGVHIEWQQPSSNQFGDAYNLMIASGEYTDIIMAKESQYQGGNDKAISDKVFIRLNELIDKYAPNYKKMRESDPERTKKTISDEGNISMFYTLMDSLEPPFFGPLVRQDWLDGLGLKTPATLDDWYIMLKGFKEKKNASAPLYFNKGGVDTGIMGAYNLTANGFTNSVDFIQVDGKVKYTALEPAFKDYLTLVNKWYSEGIIDKDFFSRQGGFMPDLSVMTTNKAGAVVHLHAMIDMMTPQMQDKNAVWAAVPYPAKVEGEKLHSIQGSSKVGGEGAFITTACKDTELAVKWLDYLYTQEGSLLLNYGTEGTSYTLADGKPKFTDAVLKDSSNRPVGVAMLAYAANPQFPMVYDWSRVYSASSESVTKAGPIWASNLDYSYVMPSVTPTTEEGAEKAKIMGDINTYASEMIIKFITGAEPLSKYDEFVNKLKSMSIEKAVGIQQAALDRYNARK